MPQVRRQSLPTDLPLLGPLPPQQKLQPGCFTSSWQFGRESLQGIAEAHAMSSDAPSAS